MIHTTPHGISQVFCRPLINYSTATFLFLSGYLTKMDNKEWGSFYKRRIDRVLFPYVIWTFVYSLPFLQTKGFVIFLANLLTAKAAAPLYYIFVYIQFVLLTPLCAKLAKSKYQFIGWLVAPLFVFFFHYYSIITGNKLNSYVVLLWSDTCFGWFTFYYLGLVFGNRIIEKNFSLNKIVMLYLASILLQIFEGYVWYLLGQNNCGSQLKMTSLLSSSLFMLMIYTILKEKSIKVDCAYLRMLGDYSFGVFLCHYMFRNIFKAFNFYEKMIFPFNSFTILFVSLLFCCIVHKAIGDKYGKRMGIC